MGDFLIQATLYDICDLILLPPEPLCLQFRAGALPEGLRFPSINPMGSEFPCPKQTDDILTP